MSDTAVQYRLDAELAQVRAKDARIPQERELLLDIERSFERLAKMRDSLDSAYLGDDGVVHHRIPKSVRS
jgi:hypothetical protein